MVFSVVMYGCESWTIKKAECQRIDPFELWCWRTLLRVTCTARSKQSILKEINPEYSLEGLMKKLKKTLGSPLDSKKFKPVNPKGTQAWIFIWRTDAEAPILWPPDMKKWLIEKDPGTGKDWRQEEKGTTVDEMVGWHHWLDGHDSKQAPGVGDGQGSLVCYSPWGCKELDMTEQLNWTDWWFSRNYITRVPMEPGALKD